VTGGGIPGEAAIMWPKTEIPIPGRSLREMSDIVLMPGRTTHLEK
jgi:hypothetical protein